MTLLCDLFLRVVFCQTQRWLTLSVRQLQQFYNRELIVKERLCSFLVADLRRLCQVSEVIDIPAAASSSACVSALVGSIAEDDQLARNHKIIFAKDVANGAEDLGDSCMLLYNEDYAYEAVEEAEEGPSSDADEGV